MRLSIDTNFPEVQRQLDLLQRDIATKVTARAMNRTIEQARTQMSREIRDDYAVDSRFVKDRLRIKRASFYSGRLELEASLDAQSKPRSANVIRFSARRTAQGVSVKIRRDGGRKVIKSAFIGNKGRTVFTRVGKQRLPIVPVQTINVPQMFNAKRINRAVVEAILQRFPIIWQREADYATGRFNT